MSTSPMIPCTAPELAKIYRDLETHCGSHAPVALLVHLQAHPHPSGLTYIMVGVLNRLILNREKALYHARADDHLAHILAYKECCDAVRKALHARLSMN